MVVNRGFDSLSNNLKIFIKNNIINIWKNSYSSIAEQTPYKGETKGQNLLGVLKNKKRGNILMAIDIFNVKENKVSRDLSSRSFLIYGD